MLTMPTPPTTLVRLQALLMQNYPVHIDRLGADAALASLGLDSLGVAELLFNVEDEFELTLPREPVALVTVGDVAQFIDALLGAQHGRAASASAAPVARLPPAA